MSERLSRLRFIVNRDRPGWDCQQVLNGQAQVRAGLQPLKLPGRN